MPDERFLVEAAERLKDLVRQGGQLDASQVGVLGLDEVKRAAGPLWSTIGPRIRQASRDRIIRLLGPNDVVLSAGDGYLVIYAPRPGLDPAVENGRIQAALHAFYLGEEETKAVRVQARVHTFDASDLEHLARPPPTQAQHAKAPTAPATPALASITPAPAAVAAANPASFVYVPVWGVKNEIIAVYWTAPMCGTAERPLIGYSEAWYTDPSEAREAREDYLELDLAILRTTLKNTENSLKRKQRYFAVISIHASTLLTPKSRARYMTELHQTSAALRQYLFARVCEIPPGTPLARISEWVNQIKPVIGRVTLHVHETETGMAGLAATGVAGIAVTLGQKQASNHGRAHYERQIPFWNSTLQRCGAAFQLDNVNEPKLLQAALAAGVDALTSFTLWPLVATPEGVRMVRRADVESAISRSLKQPNLLIVD